MSFLREPARETIAEFKALPETPLEDPPTELASLANQPPQVIN